MIRCRLYSIVAIVFLTVIGPTNCFAQARAASPGNSSATKGTADSNRKGRQVTIQQSFDPTFSIEPLTHRVDGRGGDVVAFKFKIQSVNRPAKVEVAAIGLRQELSGQILHDEQSPVTDSIRIMTPPVMELEAGVAASIQGVVRIPKGDAKFHTLGILVKDIGFGEEVKPKFNPDGTRQTQAGIRFVTQYVLRLDVEVVGARGEEGRQLKVEEVRMTASEGRPRLQALVLNPTETAFEFELRGRLRSSPSDRSFKPLRLVMPVRKTVEDETRYVGRVLPKSRLRMEELLPEAIAGGAYEADMELLLDGRVVARETLPIDVNAADYPAQEVLISQVDGGLQVSPAQIELSQARGGARRLTVLLKNNGKDAKTVTIKAIGESGLELGSLLVQPSEVPLPPGGSRKVALTLRGQADDDRVVDYGHLVVDVKSSDRDYEVSRELPLAVVLKELPSPDISISPIQWDPSPPYPSFRATVQNQGVSHWPLQARLTITAETGSSIQIPGGFGRWLMPGGSSSLEFRLDGALAPGKYRIRCELQQPGEPLVVEQEFVATDMEAAVSDNSLRSTSTN